MTEKQIQVLRTMDKLDRIGTEGVVALLQKPPAEFGAQLDIIQAELIGLFLGTTGETNEETIRNAEDFRSHAGKVMGRVEMMGFLEGHKVGDGETALDRLLAMPTNDDEVWSPGHRPKNIAWALDDLVSVLS
jgi:hypothetical protein